MKAKHASILSVIAVTLLNVTLGGDTYHFKLVILNGVVLVYLDDEIVYTSTWDRLEEKGYRSSFAGYLGVASSSSSFRIDNVKVKTPQAAKLEKAIPDAKYTVTSEKYDGISVCHSYLLDGGVAVSTASLGDYAAETVFAYKTGSDPIEYVLEPTTDPAKFVMPEFDVTVGATFTWNCVNAKANAVSKLTAKAEEVGATALINIAMAAVNAATTREILEDVITAWENVFVKFSKENPYVFEKQFNAGLVGIDKNGVTISVNWNATDLASINTALMGAQRPTSVVLDADGLVQR